MTIDLSCHSAYALLCSAAVLVALVAVLRK